MAHEHYIALLRGINVGGTGVLPMKDLAALCTGLGFGQVQTYIQSGNVLFTANLPEVAVRQQMEAALLERMGKPVAVCVRTAAEMRLLLEANPFPDREGSKVAVVFLHGAPPDACRGLTGPGGEEVLCGRRELYVYYPAGMGRTRLKLPLGQETATVRNVNTVAKLVELCRS